MLVAQSCPLFACQTPLSIVFSRQEYWSGLPFPSQGSLPEPGIKLGSPALQVDSLLSEPPGKPSGLQKLPFLEGLKKIIKFEQSSDNYKFLESLLSLGTS